jgi:tRNA acetyltransferase TAN1
MAKDQPDLISAPGIIVTAVQNKEKTAERELVEALEGIADELYPETSANQEEEEDEGEMDMEAMLKKELSGISSDTKSKRIRLCRHDTPCCMSLLLLLLPFRLSFFFSFFLLP